ncbi:MAG: nucleotide sugar dehydrogenase [Limisphaerales bacterium]
MKIVVFGAGYVGCVTGACLAKLGHRVTVTDTVASKVETLRQGRSPVLESGLDELIAGETVQGRLSGDQDSKDALLQSDMALVCVGTPCLPNGLVETKVLYRVLQSIAAQTADRAAALPVVVRSTILAPMLRQTLAQIQSNLSTSTIEVVVNPEFLRETTAVFDFFHPPFIVVGGDNEKTLDTVLELYRGIEAPRFKMSLETASVLKYACNAFHALKIGFANEIDTLATLIGADGREVMNLLTKDRVLNISPAYLRPGFAFGGSCLTKDLRALEALAREHHEPLPLLSSVLLSNRRRVEQALDVILSRPERRLAFIGLSFKVGTDDLRESPFVELAERLLGKGFEIRIYDPDCEAARLVGSNLAQVMARLPHLARALATSPEEACAGAEAVLLCKKLLGSAAVQELAARNVVIYDLDRMDAVHKLAHD